MHAIPICKPNNNYWHFQVWQLPVILHPYALFIYIQLIHPCCHVGWYTYAAVTEAPAVGRAYTQFRLEKYMLCQICPVGLFKKHQLWKLKAA